MQGVTNGSIGGFFESFNQAMVIYSNLGGVIIPCGFPSAVPVTSAVSLPVLADMLAFSLLGIETMTQISVVSHTDRLRTMPWLQGTAEIVTQAKLGHLDDKGQPAVLSMEEQNHQVLAPLPDPTQNAPLLPPILLPPHLFPRQGPTYPCM